MILLMNFVNFLVEHKAFLLGTGVFLILMYLCTCDMGVKFDEGDSFDGKSQSKKGW